MKKILFISQQAEELFDPSNKENPVVFGGAEVQLFQLSNKAAVYGFKSFTGLKSNRIKSSEDLVLLSSRVKSWHSFIMHPLEQYISISKNAPDIIVYRLFERIFLPVVLYTKIHRKKLVYMVAHDSRLDQERTDIHKRIMWWCINQCDWVFVQNKIQREQYESLFNKKNFSLLPNSCEFRNPLTTATQEGYCLWIGRAERWKQPEAFLDLAKQNPNQEFLMVCTEGNNSKYTQEIYSLVQSYKNVTLYTYIKWGEIQNLYDNAKIFINTSTQEGFPNSFLQSAIAGIPLLSLSVNPNDIFSENVGMCSGGDRQIFQENFQEMMDDPAKSHEQGTNLQKYGLKHHDLIKNSNLFYSKITTLLS